MSGGLTGEAHPPPSEWIQYQQEEEGALSCSVFDRLCFLQPVYIKRSVLSVQLTVFYFHFQGVTQELDENVISLHEILEVGLMHYIIRFVQLILLASPHQNLEQQ